jgi:hypothetical protein
VAIKFHLMNVFSPNTRSRNCAGRQRPVNPSGRSKRRCDKLLAMRRGRCATPEP